MLKMVPEAGLEPARVSPYAPQAYVSAISPPGLQSTRRLIPSHGKEAYYISRLLIVNQAKPRWNS